MDSPNPVAAPFAACVIWPAWSLKIAATPPDDCCRLDAAAIESDRILPTAAPAAAAAPIRPSFRDEPMPDMPDDNRDLTPVAASLPAVSPCPLSFVNGFWTWPVTASLSRWPRVFAETDALSAAVSVLARLSFSDFCAATSSRVSEVTRSVAIAAFRLAFVSRSSTVSSCDAFALPESRSSCSFASSIATRFAASASESRAALIFFAAAATADSSFFWSATA